MALYKFKEGQFVEPNGKGTRIDNTNLTDALALHLIEKGKAKKTQFVIKKKSK